MKLKKFACMTVLFACLGSVLAFSSACDKEEAPPPANERHDHVLTHVEAKGATCKEEGNIEYWYCEGCKQSFADEGANLLAESTAIVKSTEHAYGAWEQMQAATCQATGLLKRVCTACNNEEEKIVPSAGQHVYGADDVCTLCPVAKPSQGLAFTLSEDGSYYILSGIGECTDTKLIVPDYHEGKPVRVIGEKAFIRNAAITELVLYDTVETLETYAFGYNTNLTKVTMGNGVKKIASSGFMSCNNLTTISWSKNLESIGGAAFRSTGITELVFPDFVNGLSIGNGAFAYCTALNTVTYGKGIKYCDTNVFYDCNNIKKTITTDLAAWSEIDFDLSNGYTSAPTSISENLYLNDTLITKLEIPASVKRIGTAAFAYIETIEEVVIPDTVEEISSSAFACCSSIKKIRLPNNLKRLENSTFRQCFALTEMVIPASVEYIAVRALYNLQSLEVMEFAGTVEQWNAIEKEENWNQQPYYHTIRCSDGIAWQEEAETPTE